MLSAGLCLLLSGWLLGYGLAQLSETSSATVPVSKRSGASWSRETVSRNAQTSWRGVPTTKSSELDSLNESGEGGKPNQEGTAWIPRK